MPDMPTSHEIKQRAMANFDALASEYDNLRFTQVTAKRLIELATIPVGGRVLDIATGTGLVAMTVADIVGSSGEVIGMDISAEMIAQAKRKRAASGLTQVTFQQGDAENLDLADAWFDVVLCASGIFFMPDMVRVLEECRQVLVPGGLMGFTGFGASLMSPLTGLLVAQLAKYDIQLPPFPTLRLPDVESCEKLLADAHFTEIDVRVEQIGYFVDRDARWREIMGGLEGLAVMRLSPDQQIEIEQAHKRELDALATADGLWVDVPAIIAFGRKASN